MTDVSMPPVPSPASTRTLAWLPALNRVGGAVRGVGRFGQAGELTDAYRFHGIAPDGAVRAASRSQRLQGNSVSTMNSTAKPVAMPPLGVPTEQPAINSGSER